MYKLSVGHAKIFCDFFTSTAVFQQNLAELSANSANNSVNSTEFRIFKIFLFISHVNCISANFFQFSTIFSIFFKTSGIQFFTAEFCNTGHYYLTETGYGVKTRAGLFREPRAHGVGRLGTARK
jgi:hypothetical protein